MRNLVFGAALAAMTVAAPLAVQAQVLQGTANGAAQGAAQGSEAAGPIGGIVGGAVGAGVGAATGAVNTATGIVGGIFGVPEDRPRFHDYVVHHHHRPFAYQGDVVVGTRLPRGAVLYPVPRDYHVARGYRYATVNDRVVIVNPRTREIVDVLD